MREYMYIDPTGHLVADVFQHGQTSEQLEKQARLARVSLLQVGPTDTC
jgi:hypothetical protein